MSSIFLIICLILLSMYFIMGVAFVCLFLGMTLFFRCTNHDVKMPWLEAFQFGFGWPYYLLTDWWDKKNG